MKRYLKSNNLSSIDDIKNISGFYIFKSFTDIGKYFFVIPPIKFFPIKFQKLFI